MNQVPREACGLIVEQHGDHGTFYEVHHLRNIAPEPHTGYRIDTSIVGMVVADKAVWDQSTIIWHTHPGGKVGPSDVDVRYAHVRLKYIVMSLPHGQVRSFGSDGPDSVTTGWER